MKKSVLLATLFVAFLAVSCGNNGGGNNPGPGPGPDPEEEPITVEVKASDFGLDNQGVFTTFSYLDLTFTADRGTGIDPKYYTNKESLRFYKGNSLTISAPDNITEIEFTFTNTELEIAPDVGELVENKWSGESKEICFSVTTEASGNIAISVFKITYYSDYEEPTVNTTTFDFTGSQTADFTSATIGDVTLSAAKGTGSNGPKTYTSGDLRLYKGNVLTIEGTSISKIQFTISPKEDGTMTPDVGEFYGTIWTGEEDEINFTITNGQRRLQKVVVFHQGDPGEQPKSVATVAQDVLEAVFYGETNYDQGIEWQDGEAYITRMSDETTLVAATQDGVNRVNRVEYLEYDSEYGIQEGSWEEGDDGAFAYFADVDFETNFIAVEIGSYEEYGAIFVQFCVYLEVE